MHASTGNRLLTLAAALGCVALPWDAGAHHTAAHDQNPNPPSPLAPADTTIKSFAAGTIIIPMDGCYQRSSFISNTELDAIVEVTYGSAAADSGTSVAAGGKVCNTFAQGDDGLIPVYSLMQRLVLDGIKVHWALRAGKTSWDDYDVSITLASGGPVTWRDRGGGSDTRFASLPEIRYAGAPFIIDAADAPAALALMAGYTQTDYDKIDLHVAQTSFTAPVFSSITQLPKLALVNLDSPVKGFTINDTVLFTGSISEALMDDMTSPTSWIQWVTFDEVRAGKLINDQFELVWVPPFDLPVGGPTATQLEFLTKLSEYADAGGHVLFQDGGIGALEGFPAVPSDKPPALGAGLMTTAGIDFNGISSTWDNGDAQESTLGTDFSDPASQFGGMMWTGIGGSKYSWMPVTTGAYLDGVRRMIFTEHTVTDSKRRWDLGAWRHKDNDIDKGRIYYLGGNNWRKNTAAGFRVLLNTVFVHAKNDNASTEISRASPIIATVSGTPAIVQGTYEYPFATRRELTSATNAASFRFPHIQGHLRATALSAIGLQAVELEDRPPMFDAVDLLPAANYSGCTRFDSSCRTVFTTAVGGANPPLLMLESVNRDVLGPLMTVGMTLAPADQPTVYQTLIERVLAGDKQMNGSFVPKLGGLDRSTVAVIPASLVAGTARPTMIYVGGTDGMLHAFCGSVQAGVCDQLGRELWAYIPRTLLQDLRKNLAVIDGSPRVLDMFGDFDGTGQKSFRTVLMFQTGSGDLAAGRTPAVYALDITNPADPKVMWEFTMPDPSTPGTHELGKGQVLAAGTVTIGGARRNLVFAQTNNGAALGGAGAEGNVVTAIDVETGLQLWQHAYSFPDPVRNAANADVPWQGVPGGAVGVDKNGTGALTELVFGTLYGDLWVLDPATGASRYGTGPLFRFSTDYHPIGAPPAIYSNGGKLFAVGVTGSYWDRSGSAAWNGAGTQYAFAASLSTPSGDAPLDESDVGANVPFVYSFAGGERASAQALVVGTEIFFTTDTTDINATDYGSGTAATGKAYRLGLDGTATGSATTIVAGVGSLANNGTGLYASGGNASQQLSFDAQSTTGESVNGDLGPKVTRRLWLRSL